MANVTWTTTGLSPLCIGSTEKFQVSAFLDGVFWDLTGGSAILILSDPNGNKTSYTATIFGGGAFYVWTMAGTPGTWLRAWSLQDAQGVVQVSRPIAFSVISSPS